MRKLSRVKFKMDVDGTFGISGVEHGSYMKTYTVGRDNPLKYIRLQDEGFEFQTKDMLEICKVSFDDLDSSPSVPTRWLWKGAAKDNVLCFLYDLVAEISNMHYFSKDQLEYCVLNNYKDSEKYLNGVDFKKLCKTIYGNFHKSP